MSRSVAFFVCAAMALSMQPVYFLMTAHAGIQNITKDLEERNKQAEEKAKELQERDKRAEERLGKVQDMIKLGRLMDNEIAVIAKYRNIGDLRTISKQSKEELNASIMKLKEYLNIYSQWCKSEGDCDEEYQFKLRNLLNFSALTIES